MSITEGRNEMYVFSLNGPTFVLYGKCFAYGHIFNLYSKETGKKEIEIAYIGAIRRPSGNTINVHRSQDGITFPSWEKAIDHAIHFLNKVAETIPVLDDPTHGELPQ